MKYTLGFLFGLWWNLCLVLPSSAQELLTNLQVFENLGAACLESVPAEADTLILVPSNSSPYVTTTLIHHWQDQGKHLFSFDSLRTSDSHFLLSWEISQAAISYQRVRRKTIARSATLNLRYSLLSPDGEILEHDDCKQIFSDEIPERAIPELESLAYAETQGEPPADHWIHRHLQPVIIAATTVLAAFLFFNLRNDSGNS